MGRRPDVIIELGNLRVWLNRGHGCNHTHVAGHCMCPDNSPDELEVRLDTDLPDDIGKLIERALEDRDIEVWLTEQAAEQQCPDSGPDPDEARDRMLDDEAESARLYRERDLDK